MEMFDGIPMEIFRLVTLKLIQPIWSNLNFIGSLSLQHMQKHENVDEFCGHNISYPTTGVVLACLVPQGGSTSRGQAHVPKASLNTVPK